MLTPVCFATDLKVGWAFRRTLSTLSFFSALIFYPDFRLFKSPLSSFSSCVRRGRLIPSRFFLLFSNSWSWSTLMFISSKLFCSWAWTLSRNEARSLKYMRTRVARSASRYRSSSPGISAAFWASPGSSICCSSTKSSWLLRRSSSSYASFSISSSSRNCRWPCS